MKLNMVTPAICAAFALAGMASLPSSTQAAGPVRGYEVRDQSTRAMRAAAEVGFRGLAAGLANGQPANAKVPADFAFGVSSFAELKQAKLGYAIEKFALNLDGLQSAKSNASMTNRVVSSGEWSFVVLSKGRPVGYVDVARNQQGRWEMVGAGSAALSAVVDAKAKTYPAFRLVRVPELGATFLEVPSANGKLAYEPLGNSAGKPVMLKNVSTTVSSGQMTSLLQERMQEVITGASRAR